MKPQPSPFAPGRLSSRPAPLVRAAARALLTLLACSGLLQARTINWGGSVGARLFDSAANRLDSGYTFELGSFGSFVPDATNRDQWAAHWKVFDRAQAPAASGWNPANGFFSSSANLKTDGTSSKLATLPAATFAQGEKAYLWVFNSKTPGTGTEWALVTNNASDGNSANDWLFPSPSDQTSLPLFWRLSNATVTVFGGLNQVEGPGPFAGTPPNFDLQTHRSPAAGATPTNADLSGLAITSATLTPVFAPGTTTYTANLSSAAGSVVVTPVASDPDATVRINGTAVGSGGGGSRIALQVGSNTISIVVTAADGVTTKAYTVGVTRLTQLAAWRQTHFPGSTSSSGPGADNGKPQNDGIPNLMKFATGLDPDKPAVMPGAMGANGGNLTFTYTPSAEAVADGLVFTVEYSDSLGSGSWKSDLVDQGTIGSGGNPVTATVPKNSAGPRFLRLKVATP